MFFSALSASAICSGPRINRTFLAGGLIVVACRCGTPPSPGAGPADATDAPLFRDLASDAGIDFVHVNGATGAFYFPEIMGSGAALLDYDNDGDLDAYLVQGGSLPVPAEPGEGGASNRLYRNDLKRTTDGAFVPKFEDVTETAGVGDRAYGMGVAVADYDNDGLLDIYVTNFGPNELYRNEGDGTFTAVGRAARVDDDRWSTSATFVDFDHDGHLDLFVVNYVNFKTSDNKVCRPTGVRDYCHPSNFDPEPDTLYRNRGDGTFEDASAAAGIARTYGSGLGTAVVDLDEDGWLDIYVANDGNENQFWRNRRDGTFEDVALFSGVALNGDGAAEAGMGVSVDDFDRDGDADIFVTHLRDETNTLYRNQGNGLFEDATFNSGLGYPSLSSTGFGVHWLDFDNDGFSDLFCANGAVALGGDATGAAAGYAEPNQLFRSVDGERFELVAMDATPAMQLVETSRGAAFGDVDNDGDVDVLVSNNAGPARLLVNDVGAGRHWIAFALSRAGGERFGLGARVTLIGNDGRRATKLARTDGSYASASDRRVRFGLGGETSIRGVEVAWPGGDRELYTSLRADAVNELVQGTGVSP